MPDYKTEALAFSRVGVSYTSNDPPQYVGSRQRQYMVDRNKAMLKRAKIACDFVAADIQGLTDEFYDYTPKKIRLADAKSLSMVSQRKTDDYKEMLIDDPNIDYVPRGAKVVTMGSTFLVYNPYNLSGALPKSLLVRCNTSYNHYDAYGNVVSEPLYVGKDVMLGSENEHLKNLMLMNGYYNVVCQLNDETRKLDINQRICLGTKIYHIVGFNDFVQEFTGDRDSVHLLNFAAYIEEPTQYDDVTENFIANAKNFTFGMELDGDNTVSVGGQTELNPKLIVNGEISTAPATWTAVSENNEIVSVVSNGESIFLEGVSEGTAAVTVTLDQNPDITLNIGVHARSISMSYAEFVGAVPEEIPQYRSVTLTAQLWYGGEVQTDAEYTWTFSGADPSCFTVVVSGGTATITCIRPSDTALTVTVYAANQYADDEIFTKIRLIGY